MNEEKQREREIEDVDSTTELKARIQELEQDVLRGKADFENARKRFEKERLEASQYGAFRFAKDLLKVVDGLDMALKSVEKTQDVKSIIEGIKMIHKEFDIILERHGIEKVDALHHQLDPNIHEVVIEVEDMDSDHPAQTVVQVMQAGYKMHDRLLRPAMVSVKK